MAESWQEAPIVFLPIPVCPGCNTTTKPEIIRTQTEADGSFSRRCICRECDFRFLLVFELPETGREDFPAGRIQQMEKQT